MVTAYAKVSHELERLLGLIAANVQLPPSLDTKARDRYETLTRFLRQSPLGKYPILVYAQGSYRIGTTVKPLSGDEYDLDFVMEIALPGLVEPGDLVEALWAVFSSSTMYRGMIQRRPSCIRVLYADEFHMDIVPAIPDAGHGGTAILIPRQSEDGALHWHGTNPRGYASWFESLPPRAILEKAMAVEPLPPALSAAEKTPLQTAVQLYKRNHHVNVTDEHLRTASVVMTTIAGASAGGVDTLGSALADLVESLGAYEDPDHIPIVTNPAAEYEVLSEKWSERAVFAAFGSHARRLRQDWQQLLQLPGRDFPAMADKLSEMFGEPPVTSAVKTVSAERQKARETRTLSVAAGGILVTTPTRHTNHPHTYFGD